MRSFGPNQGLARRDLLRAGLVSIVIPPAKAVEAASVAPSLLAGWLDPPRSYRPHTRWWWPGGAVTKEGIDWQLEQMRQQGMGGAEIMHSWRFYAKGNIPYLSAEWLDMARHAIEKASELDLEVALTFGVGWSFGGSWVRPDDRSKVLAPAWVDLSGPMRFDGPLPEYKAPGKVQYLEGAQVETPGSDEGRIAAVVAGKLDGDKLDGSSLTDLTAMVEDGRLRWSVPDGRWRLMTFRFKYTGQQNQAQSEFEKPWVVDHLNKAALQRYCDYLGGIFYRSFGKHFGTTVDSMFCDSLEIHPLPDTLLWSGGTLEKFRAYKGYDFARYVPAIWFDIGELTPKVRYDVNEFLHWLGLETVFHTFDGWCARHGVQARMQPHYRFTEELIAGAGAIARPETEVSTARFEVIGDPRKATVAGARFYGRKIVSAEAYTFIHQPEHYLTTLEEMKRVADAFLRDGVTQFYDVGYLYSPEMNVAPSRDLPWANGIFHWNTWWKYYHHLTAYNSRCCFMLRQGAFAGDVLVYSPQSTVWTEKALFGVERRTMPYGNLPKTLVANGYDFDPVNDDVLQNQARVRNGRIQIRDTAYSFLILPNILALPVETLEAISSFARGGAIVIALDRLPAASVGLNDCRRKDERVRQVINGLFGPDRKGRSFAGGGRTYCIPDYRVVDSALNPGPRPPEPTPPLDAGQSRLLEIMRRHLPPDFSMAGLKQSDGLTFLHRRIEELDVYFVTNLQPNGIQTDVRFRVSGKRPERWDPMNGGIAPVVNYSATETGLEIPLSFAPWESAFFVFRPSNLGKGERTRSLTPMVSDLPAQLPLNGPWNLLLESRRFGRLERKSVHLASWVDDPDTRHFSGTGIYEIEFDVPAGYVRSELELLLDLGAVGAIAEVILNGRNAGVRWMQPYTLDITTAAQAGKNRLKVLVTNTLAPEVAGMKQPPEVPAELVPHYGPTAHVFEQGARMAAREMAVKNLPAAGLMGPVRIIPRRKTAVRLSG